MTQSKLAHRLKAVILCVAFCLAGLYLWFLPMMAEETRTVSPEFSFCFWPWLIFLWGTALPLVAALLLSWRIAGNIGADRSFCRENAREMSRISTLAFVDTAYFFIGNLVMGFAFVSHPGILLYSLFFDLVGVCVGVVAAALSHLIYKAALLREEQALTI